jgi:hypothetical protein
MIARVLGRLVPTLYFCCKICPFGAELLDFRRSHRLRWQSIALSMTVEILARPTANDILLYDVPLTLRATFYPLGFPLELATNSEAVIAAAKQSWGTFPVAYPVTPVSLNLAVTEEEDEEMPERPRFRSHQHLMSIVANVHNQVICDFSRGTASGWVTRSMAENTGMLRLRFLESSVMMMLVTAHLAPFHSALVTRNGVGVALCGESFAGKSTLAYACARSGWTFIADDGTFLLRNHQDRYAVGNPYSVRFREDAKFLFPELANCRVALRPNGALGMEVRTSELPVSTASGCSIDHVVFLRRSSSGPAKLNHFGAEGALAWLERAVLYGPAEIQAAQRQAYRRLLSAGIWELHYSDLSDAVNVLDQLGTAV